MINSGFNVPSNCLVPNTVQNISLELLNSHLMLYNSVIVSLMITVSCIVYFYFSILLYILAHNNKNFLQNLLLEKKSKNKIISGIPTFSLIILDFFFEIKSN